jgi:hypothetical protein
MRPFLDASRPVVSCGPRYGDPSSEWISRRHARQTNSYRREAGRRKSGPCSARHSGITRHLHLTPGACAPDLFARRLCRLGLSDTRCGATPGTHDRGRLAFLISGGTGSGKPTLGLPHTDWVSPARSCTSATGPRRNGGSAVARKMAGSAVPRAIYVLPPRPISSRPQDLGPPYYDDQV